MINPLWVGRLFVRMIGGIWNALTGERANARKRLREASRELKDGAVVTHPAHPLTIGRPV